MNHDDILGKLDAPAILLVVHQENVASVLGEFVVAALKCVMESFGHLEEIVPAGNDFPMGFYFDLIEERDELI